MSKRKSKYIWYYVAAALFLLYVCFYSMERTEISDIDVIRVMGIDYSDGTYTLTAMYNQNGGADNPTDGVLLIKGSGVSVYDAYSDMVVKNKRDLSIAHTTYYILSDTLARTGISDALDYFERDQTVKMNANVFVLNEDNVNAFMQKTVDDETFLNDDLAAINEKQLDQLKKVDNTLANIMGVINDKEENLLIPYLVYQDKNVYIDGYAAFKEDELTMYLDKDTSSAIDFFRNRMRSYPVVLENNVGIMITDSKVSKTVDIVNGKLQVNFKIQFQSDIKEVNEIDAIYQDYNIEQIETLQDEYVRSMLVYVVEASEESQLDLLELKKATKNQCAKEWDTISDRWNSLFRQMEYKYNISSQAAQSYVVGR